jgi:hypothetical protein
LVRLRNAAIGLDVYAAADRFGSDPTKPGGGEIVQTARSRDIGALALVVGVLLILFVLSLTLGTPAR